MKNHEGNSMVVEAVDMYKRGIGSRSTFPTLLMGVFVYVLIKNCSMAVNRTSRGKGAQQGVVGYTFFEVDQLERLMLDAGFTSVKVDCCCTQ